MDRIYIHTSVRRYDAIALGLLKKSCGTYENGAIISMLYNHLSGIIIITARPRVLVLPYGTGNKVSRNDGLIFIHTVIYALYTTHYCRAH